MANKKAIAVNTAARRPALGDLANRADKGRQVIDKKTIASITSTASNENCQLGGPTAAVDFKNVKARVDTFRKNDLPRRPIVTRTSSVKASASSSVAVAATAGIASKLVPANNSLPKLVRTKTTETATLKEVKLVDRTDRSAQLKRQDSTLTRRKAVSAAKKPITGTITIIKKTATHTKPSDSECESVASDSSIASGAAVQPRFRPPVFSSYSNGLIDGVST